MSRQLEALQEQRTKRRNTGIVEAIEYELVEAVGRAGADLIGFSVNIRPGDTLLVLRVLLAGRRQVAFVGAADLGSCLLKAVREGRSDKLKWRDDKYGGQS